MAKERLSILNRKERLLQELQDPEYRRGFVEGHATDSIAFQLRSLRKARDWEQRDVAAELGNPRLQPMISRYENPDYGRYSIATLLELAKVFDVALIVRFAAFSELVEWDWSEGEARLKPSSFSRDSKLTEIAAKIRSEESETTSRIDQQPVTGGLLENATPQSREPTASPFGPADEERKIYLALRKAL